ncbi:hypothetical protein TBLA_0D00770 [Henningerozyma blattae CBS 6284]|uniref:Major facilitator superfamily (MFS) profile domain-containing protein n=1 Tax=Henningerozyma blattae (strain ATCC 34711 / CBS 6284 / DSM 70876 / NBRC 10599 / NRRL Y-10934 / UCD 77-7) TaxID=1071380 RepID=I2H2I3_HENB6|nr:hypothetical protein TBLA_0D00770 [Tetrapisispora blattae CBS 6284]CCH60585.1 hypothetical protein TBLA_0D00770 [Tetrapisispora blattae CBS 6284]
MISNDFEINQVTQEFISEVNNKSDVDGISISKINYSANSKGDEFPTDQYEMVVGKGSLVYDSDSILRDTENQLNDSTTNYFDDDLHSIQDSKSLQDESQEEIQNQGFLLDDGIYYPEGGLKAWIATFGCFCGFFACFGIGNALGAVETQVQKYQLSSYSSTKIGWIFSLELFFTFISCIFSGTYFDRNGFKAPVIVGTILHVGGLWGTSTSNDYWEFILFFSLFLGCGNGVLISPLMSAPCHYFNRRRGLATALSTVGGSIGGAIFPVMLREFFKQTRENDSNFGYRWGIRSIAILNLSLLMLSICLVKERITPIAPVLPDNSFRTKMNNFIQVYIKNSFDANAFKDKRYLFCVIGTIMGEISICCSITYWGTYCISKGITEADVYLLIMVINVSGIPGRWVPGYFSDFIGRFNTAIITLLLLTFVEFFIWLPFGNNIRNMYIISILYGFFSGSIFSLLPVCCGQVSKTEEFGKRYATMYFVVAFATLISVPFSGTIIGNESVASYNRFIIWCSATTLVSAVCFWISKYYAVGAGQSIRF